MLADLGDEADAEFVFGMRHNYAVAPLRMSEYVVGAPNAFQYPTGLFQLADELNAPHSVYYTHDNAAVKTFVTFLCHDPNILSFYVKAFCQER